MTIEGNVKLVSSNDYVFFTDTLIYDPSTKSILSKSKVSVEGPREANVGRMYMEGIGFHLSLINNLMILENHVNGQKPMSGKRSMSIQSQRAEFSGKLKSAVFKNNVVIKVEQMIVKGSIAQFQYKDGKLDTLMMDGGIHLRDQDKVGSSGEAIVYFNEDKYIFRKKPFISQGDNELIGDEIIVFNGGQRVQVKNAKAQYQQKMEKK
jgi:lipopolysaccharide transport protein LptA